MSPPLTPDFSPLLNRSQYHNPVWKIWCHWYRIDHCRRHIPNHVRMNHVEQKLGRPTCKSGENTGGTPFRSPLSKCVPLQRSFTHRSQTCIQECWGYGYEGRDSTLSAARWPYDGRSQGFTNRDPVRWIGTDEGCGGSGRFKIRP